MTMIWKRAAISLLGIWFVAGGVWHQQFAAAITPDDPGAAALQVTVNSAANVAPISPHIYGMNSFFNTLPTGPHSGPAIRLDRLGGNRWSGYNWEKNYSSAGSDFNHVNDEYLVNYVSNTAPGQALVPSLQNANTHGRAVLATVPIAGYVSADNSGTVTAAQVAPSSRWNQVVAKKSSVYPGHAFTLNPNSNILLINPYPDEINDDYAFTDEYVHWVETVKAPGVEVFYQLDNEPGLWDNTHPRIHPTLPTFAEMKTKTIAHASAIKDVAPDALVFGPSTYGWSDFVDLHGAPDKTTSPSHPGNADFDFHEWYLNEIHNEEVVQGRTLVDVLDYHWYPEATGDGTRITFGGANNTSAAVVAARAQAPRSLWDPTYVESSWITGGCSVCTVGQPIQLLNRAQADIDTFKPGTKMSISEYNFGGGGHISGAIAQADVLGIFGREGVFAATWWNIEGTNASAAPFTYGAFNMFGNYDGAGGQFGDTSVEAATSSISQSAVYASVDSEDPNRMVVIAVNRGETSLATGIAVTHDRVFDHAEIYQLTSASATPQYVGDLELDLLNAFQYTMPGYSVTTLVLVSDGLPGDFNRDHFVDAADYTVWRNSFGESGGSNLLADADENDMVDDDDYGIWKANYGRSDVIGPGAGGLAGPVEHGVPEPIALMLILSGAVPLCAFRAPSKCRIVSAQSPLT